MSGSTIPLMGQVADPLKWLSDSQNILKQQADRYKVLAETETEKERPAQVRANAGLLGAQTGLAEADTGMRRAQTTGEQIKNELARLGLNYRTDVYQTLPLGGGNGQPAPEPDMPWSGAPGVTGADLLRGNRGGAPAAAPAVAATPPPAAPTTATPGTAAAAPTTAPNALAMYSTQAEPAAPSEVGTPALDETMKRLRAQQAAGGNQLADAAGAAAPGGNALAPTAPAAPVAAAAPAGNAAATAEEEKRAARMRQPGPNGVMIDGVGAVPLGRYKAALLTSQGDIFAAQTKLGEERRKELFYLAQSATPETWNDNVRSAYSQGWLTKGEVDHFYNHPEFQDSVVRSLSSAETAVGYQSTLIGKGLQPGPAGPQLNPTAASTMEPVHGTTQEIGPDGKPTGRTLPVIIDRGAYAQQAIDRAKAAGERMVTVSYDQPGSDGRMYPTQRQVPASMVQQGGQSAPGAGGGPVAPQQGGAAGGGMPFDRYAELTHKIEGSGKNPRSTASGNYGFVDPTWAATVRKYAPDLAAGKTDEQINATVPKGVDPPGYPGFEARMLHAFTSDNAAALQAAGLPVNASSLHLAHRLGADGMRKLVTATAATPISAIASEEVLKANPEFRRMHVGNFVDQVMGTFGTDPVNLGPRTGGEALGIKPASAAPAPLAPGAVAPQPQLPPGTMVGKPEFGPERTYAVGLDDDQVKKDAAQITELQGQATSSVQDQARLLNIRSVAAGLPTGKWGDARKEIANTFETYGGDWSNKFLKATTGIDPKQAGAWQELAKMSLDMAGQAEQQVAGSRGGFNLVKLYQGAFPGLETQPTAFKDMSNLFLIRHQFIVDHAQEAQPYYQQQREAFIAAPGAKPYQPLSTFDKNFLDQKGTSAPSVYVGAAAALNGKPYAEWTKGLSDQQIVSALRVVGRADPTAEVVGPKGKFRVAPPTAGTP